MDFCLVREVLCVQKKRGVVERTSGENMGGDWKEVQETVDGFFKKPF
jgi:hypothetical protein